MQIDNKRKFERYGPKKTYQGLTFEPKLYLKTTFWFSKLKKLEKRKLFLVTLLDI